MYAFKLKPRQPEPARSVGVDPIDELMAHHRQWVADMWRKRSEAWAGALHRRPTIRDRITLRFAAGWIIIAIGLAIAAVYTLPAQAGPLDETRYCGAPHRDSAGNIIRSSTVPRVFQRLHPCPATALPTGACPGWQKDHVLPLVCGGCDSVANMQWLPSAIKSAAGTLPKDRWEQAVYCSPQRIVP